MNVSSAAWVDRDPRDTQFSRKQRRYHPHEPEPQEEEDTIVVHGEPADEQADGLDSVE